MTNEKAKALGKAIGLLLNVCIALTSAALVGHQFHSFAIGFVVYITLDILSGIYRRVDAIKEKI